MWNVRAVTSCVATSRPRKQESDDVVATEATGELRRSSYAALRRVSCHYHDGVLTLTGRVPSYYHKQVAQTLVRDRLDGVAIRNELEVPFNEPNEGRVHGAELIANA